ncbi:hypothetical protein, partial [Frigidibacter oleivorans]|uniref:hypothetical protein n=1 Tax=Frigidibacter oleivorans TaxID=2487129 RepID=UPI00197A8474
QWANSFAQMNRCADRPLLRRRNRAKFNRRLWSQLDEHRGSQQKASTTMQGAIVLSKMLALTGVVPKRAARLASRADLPAPGSARTITTPGAARRSPSATRNSSMMSFRGM